MKGSRGRKRGGGSRGKEKRGMEPGEGQRGRRASGLRGGRGTWRATRSSKAAFAAPYSDERTIAIWFLASVNLASLPELHETAALQSGASGWIRRQEEGMGGQGL